MKLFGAQKGLIGGRLHITQNGSGHRATACPILCVIGSANIYREQ